jgi:hypothetical protein
MKLYVSRLIGCAALTLLAAALAGCPAPVIVVSPGAVDFGSASQANIRIQNSGGGSLAWKLSEVTRADEDSAWIAAEVDWLSAEATAGTVQNVLTTLTLSANTALLPVGTTSNVGVQVVSNGGQVIVPLSITVAPTLSASPAQINLGPTATTASFTLTNSGNDIAAWSVGFLADASDPTQITPLPDDVVVEPNPGTTAAQGTTLVNVRWDAGRTDFGLLVQSAAGNSVVRIKFGSVLSSLTVEPQEIRLFFNNEPPAEGETTEQVASTLRILNSTGSAVSWTLEASNRLSTSTAAPIAIAPATGSAPALGNSEVSVSVSNTVDPASVLSGAGNYELILRSGDGFILVPIIIELLTLPEIAVSEPPDDSQGNPQIVDLDLLDFGRETVQQEFWIANVGPRGSRLFFRITHEDQGVENPVLASVEPLQAAVQTEGDDFVYPGASFRMDGVPITVTVDRANLKQDVEFRTITIEAVNEDFTTVLDPVEKRTVQVRIERAPLVIEGAINRSRPPFLMRFVFLLRDSIGAVIPASKPGVLDKLTFNISEDDFPVDLNETNFFVEGPEGLKTNLVLMLDYTGSLYNAGTDDPNDPLEPGEAVAQVKEAARAFIKDLPEGYNLQLMYHNDRQQRNRLIHPFSTDRQSLLSALDAFTLPESLFGVTTIRDALDDAIESLAAEDANDTLPFDEADIRAIVFITDGVDNASLATESDISQAADDNRVRLYPLLYSAGSQSGAGDMLVLAQESGGHLYRAPNVRNLAGLLANQSGIELNQLPGTSNNFARFSVDNASRTSLDYIVSVIEDGGFIDNVSPASDNVIAGGQSINLIDLDPTGLTAGTPVVAQLSVSTQPDTGTATISVSALPSLDGGNVVIRPEDVTLSFRDPLGTVWDELSNQVTMTYVTPSQVGGDYNIQVTYEVNDTETISGSFEEDGVFAPGDVLAGQVSLVSSGIVQDPNAADPADRTRAEIYVRADYVPRDVTSFRMRFLATPPADISPAAVAALAQAETRVELAPGGLLIAGDEFSSTWRLLPEGDGIYRMRTENTNDLLYGSFGNLLKITVSNLGNFVAAFGSGTRQPEFLFEMRVDNDEYFLPAAGGLPSRTKFFLYPGGPAFFDEGASFPGNRLGVLLNESSIAGPAPTVPRLQFPGFDPEAAFPWDLDEDGIGDFQDPEPLNVAIPSALVVPDSFEIGSAVNQFNLTITNNRLDTFEWSVDNGTLPTWIDSVASSSPPGPLAPGENVLLTVTVDRTGFNDVVLSGSLNIVTDLFGTEEVELTLVVPPTN